MAEQTPDEFICKYESVCVCECVCVSERGRLDQDVMICLTGVLPCCRRV